MTGRRRTARSLRRHWQLYVLLVLPVAYFVIFQYVPMANNVIAFKDYNVVQGIWGSAWAGFEHFERFFANPVAWDLIRNTLMLSLYGFLAGFPIPIILALALNEVRLRFFKRTVQMVTYAPHFISTVIVVSMIILIFSPRIGFMADCPRLLRDATNLLADPDAFRHVYVVERHLADRRVLGDHLHGRARRHRPEPVRGCAARRGQPAAEDLARRPARASRPRSWW